MVVRWVIGELKWPIRRPTTTADQAFRLNSIFIIETVVRFVLDFFNMVKHLANRVTKTIRDADRERSLQFWR